MEGECVEHQQVCHYYLYGVPATGLPISLLAECLKPFLRLRRLPQQDASERVLTLASKHAMLVHLFLEQC